MAFAPDGQRIVTGSLDQTAKLWDAASGKELLSLGGHSGSLTSAGFSRDGQRIVSGSLDQTAKLWQASSEGQAESWRKEEQKAAEFLAAKLLERAAAVEGDRVLRAHDPGAIKDWLVLLPIAFEGGDSGRALDDEQVVRESQLRPGADERTKAGLGELV